MRRYLFIAFAFIACVFFSACKKSGGVTLPEFSAITLTPQQSVYHVGDTVVCSIKRLTDGDPSLKAATYWFYTSWWGSDPNYTADFCEPELVNGDVLFTSSKIGLSKAGEVRIYFWGRLEYPNWNFQPITIPVTLNVEK